MGNVCSEHKSPDAQDVCTWANPTTTAIYKDMPLEKVAAALELSPSVAFSIVRNRPWDAPRLAQTAIRTGKGVAEMALRHAVKQEFIRALGAGPTVDALFRSTLRLEGEGAERLQTEMRAMVEGHDNRAPRDLLATPIETRDTVAKRAASDPSYGRLYSNFFDAPAAAVEQLRVEYNERPEEFARHITHLAQMIMTSPSSAETVADAAAKLDGKGAGYVQAAIAQQLYKAMNRDVEVIKKAKEGLNQDAKPYRIRAERLVPLLATLVSKPAAARSLVTASQAGTLEVGEPSLRQLLEAILLTAYDQATQVSVRATITVGASTMLDISAGARDVKDQRDMGRTAGAFLGTAAAAEEAVGLEETTAHAVERIIEHGSAVLPSHYKLVAKGVGKILGRASKDHETDWTGPVVSTMLQEVYSTLHPSPDGSSRPRNLPSDSDAQRAYQNEFAEWRETPYEAFQDSYAEKK